MEDIKIKVENLEFFIENKRILNNISMEIPRGSFVGIIGPNGSGKSTLLKNIYRVYKPTSGKIYVDNKELLTMSSKQCAREIGVLAQESSTQFDFTVEDIVKMGRYPYKSIFEDYSKEDLDITSKMIERVGLSEHKYRNFNTLSGGEKQRTLIARILVQNAEFLILDEPTNHLDIGYQIQVMDIVKTLNITTLSAIHDMNIALMYCDYIIAMKDGEVVANGKCEEIITEELLKYLFGVNCYIGVNPITNKKHIFYMSNN
ncbi:ABC transporter ATP-binding protein [Clostridium massiliamazoniense]|uniref:ABC transporter ATP-binding protein n=1 Tax=Clostridium massiliamazoniense TaxID=1347366 RepID=UPI0009FD9D6C|nr:ABC transporter ATP-binding protein [Clostridium massiliamazoniense]